jgi:3',5'-cyclic AMP phosphodiesterase CpdA
MGPWETTTVTEDSVVLHRRHPQAHEGAGSEVRVITDLASGRDHDLDGVHVRTLDRPDGELLCRFATVNDVHFGERECGRIDDHDLGPILSVGEGEEPYPETMNRAAAQEIAALDPSAVVVKGDLTVAGTPEEFAAYAACWETTFGDRLHTVRGNHDAYAGQDRYSGDRWIRLEGVAIALMDTVIPTQTTGRLTPDQIEWLDAHAAISDTPVIVMGHHQQWVPGPGSDPSRRSEDYFGLHPDSSDALAEVMARRTGILGYAAGHTHRHRVRYSAGGVASIEVGCVKDFPGTWAEYRVYDTAVVQIVHRISHPDALSWSERCRHLYEDFGLDYASYALGTLEHRCFVLHRRDAA